MTIGARILSVFVFLLFVPLFAAPLIESDICIYEGHRAGVAAAFLAIDGDVAVQRVSYIKLRESLLADQQVPEWTAAGRNTLAK